MSLRRRCSLVLAALASGALGFAPSAGAVELNKADLTVDATVSGLLKTAKVDLRATGAATRTNGVVTLPVVSTKLDADKFNGTVSYGGGLEFVVNSQVRIGFRNLQTRTWTIDNGVTDLGVMSGQPVIAGMALPTRVNISNIKATWLWNWFGTLTLNTELQLTSSTVKLVNLVLGKPVVSTTQKWANFDIKVPTQK